MEEWEIDTPEVVANAAARGWIKAEEMGEEDSIVFLEIWKSLKAGLV